MSISIAVVGAGQFARAFIPLFQAHPGVREVAVAETDPERREAESARHGVTRTFASFEEACASDVDALALFTQRWTHGPMAVAALEAGKHVYSTVPMAFTEDEITAIIAAVRVSGRTYMMGETSYYNPAAVYCRARRAEGAFGEIFYSEGDYVHDMDLGFYDAYRYSGGERWRETASFPPMHYPTHALGGVLAVTGSHVTSVSCLGVTDKRDDGVFDREVSRFGNDISNATALFRTADGGVVRTNEFRRVGYPSPVRESRFRFLGTEGSFEQLATESLWQDKEKAVSVEALLRTAPSTGYDDAALADIDPALRDAFVSGFAQVHDRTRLPAAFAGRPNGHEGSHQFLADDFVTACLSGTQPPVNAWTAARYTLPGIVAHRSALAGGAQLPVPDHGDAPEQPPGR
ncbi:Gfo/Idh/MocA family oxidoreductase [Streptomyces sp. NPDC047046]|uniref:Gfo/Idh/MocA family protein n=1 Tax=Streptomyces sp. NPDC047046 TaxID=3155378 RepID=UPI003408F152